jgi:hypothetical protein
MTFFEQYVRIQNELHIIGHMDQVHRDLSSLRSRGYKFPVISVPYGNFLKLNIIICLEFAPILRSCFEFAVMTLMFLVVYVIEVSLTNNL